MHRRHVLLTVFLLGLLLPAAAPADSPTRRPTDEERGEQLYNRHCVQCHGERAAGDGPATRALVHPVPDLRGRITVDSATIDVVHKGRGPMPSYAESFDRSDARRVLQWMLRLSNMPPVASAPEEAPSLPEGESIPAEPR